MVILPIAIVEIVFSDYLGRHHKRLKEKETLIESSMSP